jgi:hypothetical protein
MVLTSGLATNVYPISINDFINLDTIRDAVATRTRYECIIKLVSVTVNCHHYHLFWSYVLPFLLEGGRLLRKSRCTYWNLS